jgi:hypothetical protein
LVDALKARTKRFALRLGALRTRLVGEANELTAIFAASSITARQTAAAGRPARSEIYNLSAESEI